MPLVLNVHGHATVKACYQLAWSMLKTKPEERCTLNKALQELEKLQASS